MGRSGLVIALAIWSASPSSAEPPKPTPIEVKRSAATNAGLADVAASRKLNRSVRFDDLQQVEPKAPLLETSSAPDGLARSQAAAAKAAQKRMDRSVTNGQRTDTSARVRTGVRDNARAEWDAAAENCRKTPGCVPVYRSDGARKALKTDKELLQDVARERGLSGAPRTE